MAVLSACRRLAGSGAIAQAGAVEDPEAYGDEKPRHEVLGLLLGGVFALALCGLVLSARRGKGGAHPSAFRSPPSSG